MSEDDINTRAIEMVIDMAQKQESDICIFKSQCESDVQSIRNLCMELCSKCESISRENEVLRARLSALEKHVKSQVNILDSRIRLVELDTGGDHDYYGHKIDVRDEWAEQLGVAVQLGLYDNLSQT